MIQFLTPTNATLRNFQTRMERHGDTDIAAMDLSLSVTGSNELLDMFHADLLPFAFKALNERPGELSLPTSGLPSIRFPLLKMPLAFDFEHAGMTLRIAYGATGKADMVVSDVTLSKPRVEALIEGGSVELRFTLSSTDVNEKILGKLPLLQKHELSITLMPAEVKATDMEDKKAKAKAEADALFNTPPAQQTPEEAFTGTAH